MSEGFFYYLFSRRWPVMLVVVAGIIFAIVRWKRHPKISALAITGLLAFQLQALAFSSMYYFLPRLATRGWSWASIDNLSVLIDVGHDIFYAVTVAILAGAIFSKRPKHAASVKN